MYNTQSCLQRGVGTLRLKVENLLHHRVLPHVIVTLDQLFTGNTV